MHASIRRYKVDPSEMGDIAKRVPGVTEIMAKLPGFKSYYVVRGSGDNTLVTVSVFADRAGAEKSAETAAKWVKENLSGLSIGPPEIVLGEVVAHK